MLLVRDTVGTYVKRAHLPVQSFKSRRCWEARKNAKSSSGRRRFGNAIRATTTTKATAARAGTAA